MPLSPKVRRRGPALQSAQGRRRKVFPLGHEIPLSQHSHQVSQGTKHQQNSAHIFKRFPKKI